MSLDNFINSAEAKALQEAEELERQKNCDHAPIKWKDIFIDSKSNQVVRKCECGYVQTTTKTVLDQVIASSRSAKAIVNFLMTFPANGQPDNKEKTLSTKSQD